MPPKDTLLAASEIKLQSDLLQLGKDLSERRSKRIRLRGDRQVDQAEVEATELRILHAIRSSPVRRLFRIQGNFNTPHDIVRVRAVAYIGWEMVSESAPSTRIEQVALTISDPTQPVCEQLILVRDALGRMVSDGALLMAPDHGGAWSGRLLLAANTYSWVNGGPKSRSDFAPSKIDAVVRQDGSRYDAAERDCTEKKMPTARQIYDGITRQVFDCEGPAEVISSRLILHMMRARMLRADKDPGTPNECWTILGPPGCGKTTLCEVACKTAEKLSGGSMPFATADGSDLTADGFVGLAFSDTLRNLLVAANGDVEKARYGFLAIDEFTKKARSMGGESPVSTVGVQQEALRVISGQSMQLGGRRGWDRPIAISTVGTGFALLGHAPGLDRMIEKRMGKRGLGFSIGDGDRRSKTVIANALLDFGFIEEIVSRQTAFLIVRPPSKSTLSRAVTSEDGILASYNRLLAAQGSSLVLTPSAIECLIGYGMECGFFRDIKRAISTLAGELVFSGSTGTITMEATDVQRAITKADGEATDLLQETVRNDDAGFASVADESAAPGLGNRMTASGL